MRIEAMNDVSNRWKNVNNTDINSEDTPTEDAPIRYDMIELLFFAYRDFVGQADAILAGYGFGRAHHRVIHFVNRNPGITVAELLDILRITKQSLGRVLKQLIDQGFVVQTEGPRDRRQRLLHASARGAALAEELAALQSARLGDALRAAEEAAGPGADAAVHRFLLAVIGEADRADVLRALRSRTQGA